MNKDFQGSPHLPTARRTVIFKSDVHSPILAKKKDII